MAHGVILYTWTGEAMEPLPRFRKVADKEFVVGETYTLAPVEERSSASHAHYFASIHEIWMNLPEHVAEQWPSADHLRRYALIKTGYCDRRTISFNTKADAIRAAAFIKPMDPFSVVIPEEYTVTVYTARSQSYRSMKKADFQASKTATLDYLAGLIGANKDDIGEAA